VCKISGVSCGLEAAPWGMLCVRLRMVHSMFAQVPHACYMRAKSMLLPAGPWCMSLVCIVVAKLLRTNHYA
jgi:hypothetical protein